MTSGTWLWIAFWASMVACCLAGEPPMDLDVSPTISTLAPFDHELVHPAQRQTEGLELATLDEDIQNLALEPSDFTLTEPPAFVLAMMAIFTLLGGRHLVRRR